MARWFRETYPGETAAMDDEVLEAWVRRNVDRAATFGIEMEPDVAQYLLLCLLLGEDAPDRLPWMQKALQNRKLMGQGRVRAAVRAADAEGVPDLDRFVMDSFAT
jgi:hypothetical protein